ncbi:transmembrane and coiled-coil domain-containing protein 6 [Plectropomus leopardus]|uniref:transmembrane and coiled-coil domain-containing protein 6 n=1 Tax=Plectropomus leopardus TaxID=160734 RepID=UPI001C4AF05E|nr:transmembrane and coiled-coil domain-containing protein 6 [Plectropomus leopardus]
MWRLNKVRHKVGRQGDSLEEFRLKRREQEKALRQARRDRQLVSKRLVVNEDEEQPEVTMDTNSGEQDVVSLYHRLQHSGLEREAHLKALSKALRDPSAQLAFIKQENSMHLLVGLLTGSDATCRLHAVRCLHELSHSPHANVAPACLPATPYLLTYLSGQSTKFTELCLYTLGNLCPDSDAVKEKLLAQGLVPALGHCMENQRHNLAVVEAVGFTLSQLLQAKDAAETIIPMVLASSLPPHLLSVLTPDPNFGLAPAIECAWCLHYLTCSYGDNTVLLAHGALSQCSSLLVSLGGAVAAGNKEEGMELLICPLLRCVGNLLSSCPLEDLGTQVGDMRLVVALCALLQAYLQSQPALARESAWVLNNLTAHSGAFCSALLTLNLVPGLIQLLPYSQGINTMILRVLANVAHKRKEFCVELAHRGLLSALCATLKMANQEMVTLSMDILLMLVVSGQQVAEEFVRHGGLSLLEAIQYNSEGAIRRRATHLLEHHLPSYSSYCSADNIPPEPTRRHQSPT